MMDSSRRLNKRSRVCNQLQHPSTSRVQIKTQTAKTLVETTQPELQGKIAEVVDSFFQGLNLTQHKFERQLKEVEA
jgi:hypothetical protein